MKEKATIFIVDDDAVLSNLFRLILESEGYRVFVFSDGSSCLQALRGGAFFPDLVLVDYSMPQMSGDAFLLKLQEEFPVIFSESRVVGFTCHESQSSPYKRIEELAFACRQKPVGIRETLQMAEDFLAMPLRGDLAEKLDKKRIGVY